MMDSRCMRVGLLAAAWVLASAALPAAADELILKSGQKIAGSIVGYEQGMFRVETEFGVALVRKDKVASIQVSTAGDSGAKQTEKSPRAETPKPTPNSPAKVAQASAAPAERPAGVTSPPATGAPAAPVAKSSPPPPPVSQPVDEPLPAHIQEHVEGNTYVNDTFRFAMFKPPDWKVYENVPGETGSGVTAIGTDDEQTLFVVDRQVWSGAPDLRADQIEARLKGTYENYRKLSEETIQLRGQPAIHRTFTGVLDGAEWHGVAVHVANGNAVFGLIGLTSAEMFEFKQAVLSKIIASFHFQDSASPPSSRPKP